MNAFNLIKKIQFSGGIFLIEGNRLIIDLPEGVLNEEELANIKIEKNNFLKILELQQLIKQIDKAYGGNDSKFLEEYSNDVIKDWKHDLEAALLCFKKVTKQPVC